MRAQDWQQAPACHMGGLFKDPAVSACVLGMNYYGCGPFSQCWGAGVGTLRV